jgi:hypothetical protein
MLAFLLAFHRIAATPRTEANSVPRWKNSSTRPFWKYRRALVALIAGVALLLRPAMEK